MPLRDVVAVRQALLLMPAPMIDPRPSVSPESESVLDLSKMNAGQRAALEITEAARESHAAAGFVADLFMGAWKPRKIYPLDDIAVEEKPRAEKFLASLAAFLRERVDPDLIDRTGEIPPEVMSGLADLGAYGIKIPREYGGLGLSQTTYCRVCTLIGSHCGSVFAHLSVHQSVGVPQPLMLFGTEEQKRAFLPRVARGEISAFALTESGVGSDPARMTTRAEPTPDGGSFIINGEKLWCSNGTRAGLLIVACKTPARYVGGRAREQITTFIVEANTPGFEVVHRCQFMGLHALYNGVIRFRNVHVPRANILGGEGRGLKVALTTLNSGRLSIPAASLGVTKRALAIAREWSGERVQWGVPIGEHALIAEKIRRIAASAFAMEAIVAVTARAVDRDERADIRLEAAMCKLWGTEKAWATLDHLMQIRGGRGYETVASLRARGEKPYPVERMMRDHRVSLTFEGASEILRLFILREALDRHLRIAGVALNTERPWRERLGSGARAAVFYLAWYPRQWLPVIGAGGHAPGAGAPFGAGGAAEPPDGADIVSPNGEVRAEAGKAATAARTRGRHRCGYLRAQRVVCTGAEADRRGRAGGARGGGGERCRDAGRRADRAGLPRDRRQHRHGRLRAGAGCCRRRAPLAGARDRGLTADRGG